MLNDNILEEKFIISSQEVQNLKQKPSDQELLKLYGLYKQSLFGNNNTEQPSFFDFKAKAKWNAWYNESGKGKTRTKKEYIEFVEILKNKYS
jgi:diazepam-binding inhibitor (GABA receptor modulating acyl-CoA-binding protein)